VKKKNDVSSKPLPVPPGDTSTLFSRRDGPEVVEFNKKLWLIGGFAPEGMKNDVWSSEDSLHWKKEL